MEYKIQEGTIQIVNTGADNFSKIEIWYREDIRHRPNALYTRITKPLPAND